MGTVSYASGDDLSSRSGFSFGSLPTRFSVRGFPPSTGNLRASARRAQASRDRRHSSTLYTSCGAEEGHRHDHQQGSAARAELGLDSVRSGTTCPRRSGHRPPPADARLPAASSDGSGPGGATGRGECRTDFQSVLTRRLDGLEIRPDSTAGRIGNPSYRIQPTRGDVKASQPGRGRGQTGSSSKCGARRSRSSKRARCSRLLTAGTVRPRRSAISAFGNPSRSERTSTVR